MARLFQRSNAEKRLDQEAAGAASRFAALATRVETLETEQADLVEDVDLLAARVDETEDDIAAHATRLSSLEGRVLVLESS